MVMFRNHNPVLSSVMTYHRGCNNSNTTAVACGTGTAYYSTAPAFTPGFSGIRVARFLCSVLKIIFCPFVLFPLSIVLSALLRFTASDYPFDIFKLFIE